MASDQPRDPEFYVTHEPDPGRTLVIAFSQFGLAGLTALDFLVDHLDLEETGHITAEQLPSITPFSDGEPRHHTRLYSRPEFDFTYLVGELFVPVFAAAPFSRAILSWTDQNAIEEIVVLSGIPIAHGPDEHGTFYIATEDYRERRLSDTDLPPMGSGFLDGVNAALIERGMDTDLAVGLYATPVHSQVPDVDAALRLLDTLTAVYDLDVDTAPLENFAEEIERHYQELSERITSADRRVVPEDRMFM